MLALKFLLTILGFGLFGSAAAIVAYDVFVATRLRWLLENSTAPSGEGTAAIQPRPFGPVRWSLAQKLALVGILPILLALSITVIPDGYAGIRVSQISGVHPTTLYPGVHLQTPFIDKIVLYDTREQVFSTAATPSPKSMNEVLTVQAREGLNLGLAVTVRYRLDPTRLSAIHQNLPQPVSEQVVGPVVSSIYRQLAPNYVTREIFAVKREELRTQAADAIKTRLASDGILVREVMLRDIELPPEYAKGLESLLLKEQENDRMGVETEIHQKQVKVAEADAEATKVQQVKGAEGQAAVRVLEAKGESDAMQYLLPLKEKQIQQSKLEAEARKEATVQNAEAAGEAKLIDSKAEGERRKLLAQAEAERIRLTASADAERMASEAAILKQNPLLINKIVAERLSDKLQIMMVPMDGKNFFASDVLRSAFQSGNNNSNGATAVDSADDSGDPAPFASNPAQQRSARRP